MRVKLKKDLTKYHPTLIAGVIGEVIGVHGKHSQKFPRVFTGVKFPAHTLDVMWEQLERIKEETVAPKMGPRVEREFDRPPKRGEVLDISGIKFQVHSIEYQVDETTWAVNLIPV